MNFNWSTKHANIPPELVGRVLLDSHGRMYRVIERKKPIFFGLFTRTNTEIVFENECPERSLEKNVKQAANTLFRRWATKTVRPALLKTPLAAARLIEECLQAGQRNFRKEFVSIIGTQGEKLFTEIAEKKLQSVGELWARSAQQKSTLHKGGPYPKGVRFAWELKTPEHELITYCIENAPQRHTIDFQEEYGVASRFRRFAFPWVYFIVFFRDGLFKRLAVFYRGEQLQETDGNLCFTNLPSHYASKDRYYAVCDERMPSIKLSDLKWESKLFEWYWASKFYNHGNTSIALWKMNAESIPEVSSADRWQELSNKEDFTEAICRLPWVPCGHTLESYVTWVMKDICPSESGCEALKGGKAKTMAAGIASHAAHFRELLEEKIVFLGTHFSVPHEYFEAARDFVENGLQNTCGRIEQTLNRQCRRIAKEVSRNCLDGFAELKISEGSELEGGHADSADLVPRPENT